MKKMNEMLINLEKQAEVKLQEIKVYTNLEPVPSQKELYRNHLRYEKPYFLMTFTFDPEIAGQNDNRGQERKLIQIMDQFTRYQYFGCTEKHKSGILHAHVLITGADIHTLEHKCDMSKSLITNSRKLKPAIKIDCVKQTTTDIDRTYNYIWDNKKDHPIYKFMKINI